MKKLSTLLLALVASLAVMATEGALPGKFTINAQGDQIVFSQGNLQYQAAPTPKWQFATNQYDMIGGDNVNVSDTYTGWIDLFCWNSATNPTQTDESNPASTFVDWGTNPISNGGNVANAWRTLSGAEWIYIFENRTNAATLIGQGSIDGVNGLIILPDNWTLPTGLTFTPKPNNYTTNVYTATEWGYMQDNGAVFLPAGGWRSKGTIVYTGEHNSVGCYWAANQNPTFTTALSHMNFTTNFISGYLLGGALKGACNVRLVQAAPADPVEPCSLEQDEEGYYLLGSVQDWKEFAALVNGGNITANAKMTADINLGDDQTMVGTDAAPYAGIFDGQGHTLTVNYSIYSVETAVAPFACVNGATILNLHVDGSIRQRRCAAGGVVGSVNGNLTVKKCWVSATLTVDGEGNYQGTIGGIASCCDNSSVQGKSILLEDCLFSGYVATGVHCGGLMSHVHGSNGYNNSAAFNNCLNIGTCNGPSGSTGTFIRTGVQGDPYTITNCYYKTAWRVAQGAQATETELADGTTATALQAGRAEEIWVQDGTTPMLKIFASEITPVEPTGWEDGVLPGKFTINANGDQIFFSQGNLQYQASTETWRFAENQYDMKGWGNENISDTYDDWIDLFGWGTGNNPTNTSQNNDDYSVFTDWGTNAISNGGNTANMWRTLTNDEWYYLLNTRENAASLQGLGTVLGVRGAILLPDEWVLPDGASFVTDPESKAFTDNVYSTEESWSLMENAGAVFFPRACRRFGTTFIDDDGYYWSSSQCGSAAAFMFNVKPADVRTTCGNLRLGFSVRLTQAAPSEPVDPDVPQQDEDGYYLLGSVQDLNYFTELVNSGSVNINARMTADIDLEGSEANQWTPIGNSTYKYNGVFDGQGHVVKNLYYKYAGIAGVGFIGVGSSGAYIKNLRVEGYVDNSNGSGTGSGEAQTCAGGIMGASEEATIINCSFSGSVISYSGVAGIVGCNTALIINCYNEGEVIFHATSGQGGSGIHGTYDGYHHQQVINSYNVGSVINNGYSTSYMGSISCSGTISNCYSRENCCQNGNGASWTNTGNYGTAMSLSDMKTEDFVATLNGNVAALKSTYPDISEWVLDPITNLPIQAIFASADPGPATSIDSVTGNPSPVTLKVLRDGQLLILRGDKTYTVQGAEVK